MTATRFLTLAVFGLCGVLLFSGFVALGVWQLERREWKLDLMQQVDDRVHAEAVLAPKVADWPKVSKQTDEYRHVSVTGKFLPLKDALVVAATELCSGYWVLTPFERRDGSIVIVNRGYIGQGVEPSPPPEQQVTVSGLLRMSEPKGSVLRDNDPAADRWYSRDVQAIAATRKITAAPYFIDSAKQQPGSNGVASVVPQGAALRGHPVGGLTVIQFHNSHMVYAVTWFGLALMVIGAAGIILREKRKERHAPNEPPA